MAAQPAASAYRPGKACRGALTCRRATTNGTGEIAANPGGIVIDRTPTDEDRDARQAWLKAKGHGDLAAAE